MRLVRQADPALASQVAALKAYQARRFSLTYADLLVHPRYQGAAHFFLEDLYGPQEFGRRDAQFARVVPALVRLFPHEIVGTVEALARLHALSESLDQAMAMALGTIGNVDAAAYARAWQSVGHAAQREEQIELTLEIGRALDHYTRNPVLRGTLRMMRRPAHAAGLGDLQRFLERGFDTFAAMAGAQDFLDLVDQREHRLAAALFDPATPAALLDHPAGTPGLPPALGQLP